MLSACATTVDRDHRELLRHGTAAFPVGCYHDDLHQADVIWHWHEELEAGLVAQGSALVTIGSRTEHLRTGDAFFINTGVLHAARPGQAGPCRLHSLVFHPRLVGGSPESVFYQDYLLPLTARPEQQNLVLRAEAPGCPTLSLRCGRRCPTWWPCCTTTWPGPPPPASTAGRCGTPSGSRRCWAASTAAMPSR